ncbi:hypothetical protein [Halopiger thermotolerans]
MSGLTLPLAGCANEAAEGDENETDNETETETNETDAETSEDGEGDSVDEPEDQEFSGSGDDAIEDVSIEGGLTVVDATFEGDEEFEVRLIPQDRVDTGGDGEDDTGGNRSAAGDEDTDGNETDVSGAGNETDDGAAGNETDDGDESGGGDEDESAEEPESVLFVKSEFVDSGEYEGQTAHPVVEGTYVLSVVADGDWEVTVSQPRAESGEEPPISVDGSGNEVHGPFEFDGSHQPSGEYDGEWIVADIYPVSDDPVFMLHEGNIENPSEFEFEGVGYLSVKSDGEWTVEIE